MTPPRVLLADRRRSERRTMRELLERDGFTVCGEPESRDEALEQAVEERPEICLVSADLPGDGIRATAEISDRLDGSAVVVLTSSATRDQFLDAVQAGAAGYLVRDMDPGRLPDALRGVLRGEAAMPRNLLPALLSDYRSRDDAGRPRRSDS